ncbi:DUF4279 domain-containing protein [Promicromonospora sp. NPDC059942]|uniref:DUF4279 domain-containing protein n=1 Tax=Promicromonospora sp. NPDC059942 TaxID=3347009 RepID=UPI003667A4AA
MSANRVELVLASDQIDPTAMISLLGQPADESIWRGEVLPSSRSRRPAREHACVFRESARSTDDFAYALLSRLRSRVDPMLEGLQGLAEQGCRVKLSVVQELSDGNASDGSFMMGQEWIDILARVGATVDVELISAG